MGKTEHNIAILILAAGGSTRMGNTIKQLLPWKNTTLLGHAISEAKASNSLEVMVVLGAHAHRIRKEINEEEVLTAIHVDWESGLGSSLAFGMRQLWNRNTSLEGVLVMLVDQPLINSDYINRMIALFHTSEKKIIATNYDKRGGVPAIFGKTYFNELLGLNADFGAKDILTRRKEDILLVYPKGKAIDVDTMEDYDKLYKGH